MAEVSDGRSTSRENWAYDATHSRGRFAPHATGRLMRVRGITPLAALALSACGTGSAPRAAAPDAGTTDLDAGCAGPAVDADTEKPI
jgi:hypothetical protein